jgi:hypothetical protein
LQFWSCMPFLWEEFHNHDWDSFFPPFLLVFDKHKNGSTGLLVQIICAKELARISFMVQNLCKPMWFPQMSQIDNFIKKLSWIDKHD